MSLLFVLQASGKDAMISNLIFMGGLFAVAYFFFIRPQAKYRKEHKEFTETVKKGDEVVTNSGIIGKISKLDEKEVTLQTSEKNFIRVTRNSLSKELSDQFHNVETK